MKAKLKAIVYKNLCVACGCCAKICPISAIKIHNGFYADVSDRCVGCGKCKKECPASVIELVEF